MTKKNFSSDVEQLIQLVTHSIYSDKEVFLRELISNANDAIQKAKIQSAKDPDYLGDDHDLKILIDIDKDNGILTISDNGIGMTSTEVEKNIGVIAKSGTKDFIEKLKKSKGNREENNMIGQFGIGFYSVFMVSKKVELETKSNKSKKSTLWISDGAGTYEITDGKKENRGTEIKIYIKEESKDFLDENKIKSLVKKHSNYIPVPIMLSSTDKKSEKKYEQINEMKSIWTKRKSEVKPEEYKNFYQNLSFDSNEPLDIIHTNIEGVINYKSLLFIPQQKNPMFMFGQEDKNYGPQLYIQNVMVKEKAEELLPPRLRFIRGVVETNDLPLNISREILQNNTVISKIESSLTKEVIKSLTRTKNKNREKYETFFKDYGQYIKEGIHIDFANREKIAELLLFSSLLEDKNITLDEYLSKYNKDTKEKKIYYLTGKNILELKSDPILKQFQSKKIDVLLMDSPLDERVIASLPKFKDFEFISVKSEDINLDDTKNIEEKNKEINKIEGEHKDFIAFLIQELGTDNIEKIKFVKKDKEVLSNFVHKPGEPTAQMEKIYKAMGQDIPKIKKSLSLNLDNLLTQKIIDLYKKDNNNSLIKDFAKYIYDQAILIDGGELENVHEFVNIANKLALNNF